MPVGERRWLHDAIVWSVRAGLLAAAGLLVSLGGRAADGAQPRNVDEWLATVGKLPSGSRAQAIEGDVVAHGGTPLVFGREVLFLYRTKSARPPRVVGDFNGWGVTGDRFDASAGTMSRIAGTDWYSLRAELRPDARIEYLVDPGDGELVVDPRARRAVQSFGRASSELAMPRYTRPPELDAPPPPGRGHVDAHQVSSARLGNRRQVSVYVPFGYERSGSRYAVIYFHDGTAWIEQGQAPRLLDVLIARRAIRPVIGVFVDPVLRGEEYRMNPRFRDFFATELLPFVERRYHVQAAREGRAIVGSSRGALAAFDLAFHRPDLFSFCAAIAPATQPLPVTTIVASAPRREVRVFLLVGLYDRRWLPDGRALRDALEARAYPLVYREVPEGHSFVAWRSHLGEILRAFAGTDRPLVPVPKADRAR